MRGRLERVVIDANIALALAIELPYSSAARTRFAGLSSSRRRIYVPLLWEYELASALAKAAHLRLLTPDEASRALEQLLQLNLYRVAPDIELHRAALRWASRLGQAAAYDAQYLALAERLGAELWTADRSLADHADHCGVRWVRSISG